jgi:hypothetical protein
MLNGISSICDKSIQNIDKLGINTTHIESKQHKQEMIQHYTIQEQRDIANDVCVNKIQQHSAGTLELF